LNGGSAHYYDHLLQQRIVILLQESYFFRENISKLDGFKQFYQET